jgi:hypothetical protein
LSTFLRLTVINATDPCSVRAYTLSLCLDCLQERLISKKCRERDEVDIEEEGTKSAKGDATSASMEAGARKYVVTHITSWECGAILDDELRGESRTFIQPGQYLRLTLYDEVKNYEEE